MKQNEFNGSIKGLYNLFKDQTLEIIEGDHLNLVTS